MVRMASPPITIPKSRGNMVSDIHMEREVAFAMALHDRLGANSAASVLQSEEIADLICKRAKKPMLMVIGGKDPTNNSSIEAVECYDPDTREWASMQSMPGRQPFARRGLAAAAIKGRMYLVGGQYSGAYSDTAAPIFCRYHPNAMVQSCGDRMGDWRHEAPLPTARSYLAATCGEDEDSLYAIGGFEGSLGMRYLATVERYSASRDEWVECPGIEGGRSHLAAATLRNGSNGSSVFALGGYSDGRAWADVERFDAGRGAWVKEAAMPTARDSLAAVALGARLFALGGCVEGGVTNLATVEALDPRVGKWHAEASMPSVRALLSAAVVGERLFVLGGNSSKLGSNFNAVHSLDPRVNKWEEEAPMLSSRIGAAIAVL